MSALVVRGDARRLPLPDGSVDLVCTSPPYFSLRSYTDGGEHYDGQVGSEPTPTDFLEALWEVTAECVRVLKPGGSIFVNLGDKYAGSGGHNNAGLPGATSALHPKAKVQAAAAGERRAADRATRRSAPDRYNQASDGIRPKSLMGLPWRYAIGCIDRLGLILRAEIVWSKPNGLPESVTDRVRRSHEQWFHMVKEPRYYAAVDEVRDGYSERVQERQVYAGRRGVIPPSKPNPDRNDGGGAYGILGFGADGTNPLGALPGSVQTVATEPLSVPAHLNVDHFAAFPSWWPWWIIKGWSPPGICVECGEGRRPSIEAERVKPPAHGARSTTGKVHGDGPNDHRATPERFDLARSITGYACACPTPTAPTRPAVILDPFGGTGTVALMADALGRHGITVDLSADYSRLADWRIFESGQGPRLLAKHEGHRSVVGLPQRTHPTLFETSP